MAGERQPVFGEWFTGIYASDDNPQKHGMYVRTRRRAHGRMNAGTFYELTDGEGRFWECPVKNVVRRAAPPSFLARLLVEALGGEEAVVVGLRDAFDAHADVRLPHLVLEAAARDWLCSLTATEAQDG